MQTTSGNVGLTTAAGSPPPAWSGFRPLTITGVDRETSSVMSLRLVAADGAALPTPQPGQYLTVRLVHRFRRDRRAELLPLGATERPGLPDQRQAGARRHRQQPPPRHRRPGQTIEAAAPRGTFTLAPGTDPVALVSAGVGVTPVLAMLHALVADGSNRPVWWVHGARNGSEHPFAAEARGLLAQLPGARSQICYSSPSADDRLDEPGVRVGHVTGDVIAGLGLPTHAHVYLCGPARFMADLTADARWARGRRRPPPHGELRDVGCHHPWCGRWARRVLLASPTDHPEPALR